MGGLSASGYGSCSGVERGCTHRTGEGITAGRNMVEYTRNATTLVEQLRARPHDETADKCAI
jgi:hypothetical protein